MFITYIMTPHESYNGIVLFTLKDFSQFLRVLMFRLFWLIGVSLPQTDCGLSVSWNPAEDPESCDEFSPASIKDKCTGPEIEVQHSVVSSVTATKESSQPH